MGRLVVAAGARERMTYITANGICIAAPSSAPRFYTDFSRRLWTSGGGRRNDARAAPLLQWLSTRCLCRMLHSYSIS